MFGGAIGAKARHEGTLIFNKCLKLIFIFTHSTGNNTMSKARGKISRQRHKFGIYERTNAHMSRKGVHYIHGR